VHDKNPLNVLRFLGAKKNVLVDEEISLQFSHGILDALRH
jgi:hypothetical protein